MQKEAGGRLITAEHFSWVKLAEEPLFYKYTISNPGSRHANKRDKRRSHTLSRVTFFPNDKVPEADGGEGDDDKVDRLKCAPIFDVLEDDGRQGHEDEAPEEDEEQGRDDTDLRLADFPLLGKVQHAETKSELKKNWVSM